MASKPRKPKRSRAKGKAMAKAKATRPAKAQAAVSVAARTFPILTLQQASATMYAFVAPASFLRAIAGVTRREDDLEKGYQRHLRESRLKQVAKYVEEGGVIPNNIILDLYGDAVVVDVAKETITISGTKCAWVIDGQHRLFGFEHTQKDYPLLVVAFLKLDEKQEVDTFVTINTQQKRLPSSLVLDLLGITGNEEDIRMRCRELVARLNEEEDSPWRGGIDMTGEMGGHISLVNFVRKVRPLIDTGGVLRACTFEEQYRVLANFWSAVKAVFAPQWGSKGSLLTKTLGFGALMNALPTVFTKTLSLKSGAFSVDAVSEIMSLMSEFRFDSDTLGSGSGNKAEMAAARVIEEQLEEALAQHRPAGAKGDLKL
jgi:DNA sulfur modification protein DndB